MQYGFGEQKKAVESGMWPLLRFDPRLADEGKNPLQLDSKAPKISVKEYAYGQTRWKMLTKSMPENAARLIELAQAEVDSRWKLYQKLASDNGEA
jgi:pyruvate-ferredoxin/flavodoxin oxidoreductase